MRRGALLTLLLCVNPPAAMPSATAVQLNYTVYVLAVPIAEAALNIDLEPSSYRTALRVHTVGLASLVANNRVEDHANGRFADDQAVPVEYNSNVRLRGEDRFVGLTWRDGVPVVTAFTPDAAREDVPTALRANTIDPLTSLTLLLRIVSQTGRCDASAHTYNGRRLQSFQVTTAGEEDIPPSRHSSFAGRGLRCDFTEQTLAGFLVDANRDDAGRKRRGSIWLATVLPDTPLLPVRASFEAAWYGDVIVYLTAARP